MKYNLYPFSSHSYITLLISSLSSVCDFIIMLMGSLSQDLYISWCCYQPVSAQYYTYYALALNIIQTMFTDRVNTVSVWKSLNGGLRWKDKSSAVIWLPFCWIKDWQQRVGKGLLEGGYIIELDGGMKRRRGGVPNEGMGVVQCWPACLFSVCSCVCIYASVSVSFWVCFLCSSDGECLCECACVLVGELKGDLNASVEGGCFERRRSGGCEAALQRDG